MSVIHEIKGENQEYRAEDPKDIKKGVNERQNYTYEGQGKVQFANEEQGEIGVIKCQKEDAWDKRENGGDHKRKTIFVAIFFTDVVSKNQYGDIKADKDD